MACQTAAPIKLVLDDGAAETMSSAAVWRLVMNGLVVIRAHYDDDMGPDSGSAYVYRLGAKEMLLQMLAKLASEDGASGDHFGFLVAIGEW